MAKASKAAAPEWLSVTQLAAARGVGKSAISRRVARMEASGLLKVRLENGSKLVNVAEFERACLIATDAVRELNGSASKNKKSKRAEVGGNGPSLATEQYRKTSIQADLAQLVLDQRRGELFNRDEVEAATRRLGEIMVKRLEALPTLAEGIAEIAARDGAVGLRRYLKERVRQLRQDVADALGAFAASKAEPDEGG